MKLLVLFLLCLDGECDESECNESDLCDNVECYEHLLCDENYVNLQVIETSLCRGGVAEILYLVLCYFFVERRPSDCTASNSLTPP
jgi:hypothetical protein